jgi:pimeloyl-ACP methyl ester carboxylesterase
LPRVASNGIELAYEVTGTGVPLLMVMGFGAQMVVWHPQLVERFVQMGFQVIRFDNRDCGESSWMEGEMAPSARRAIVLGLLGLPVGAPYDLSDMARDTAGLLDALDIPQAHVMGVSMGGMIAQHLALEHPERVLSLTSVMSGPGTRRHMVGTPEAIRAILGPPPRSREAAMDRAENLFRVIGGELEPDMTFVRARAAQAWDRGHNPSGTRRQWAAMLASGSRMAGLRSLDLPALVLHGTADPLVPARAGRATAAAIPNARLVMVEGMGHELAPSMWSTVLDAVGSVTGVGGPSGQR